MSRNDSPASRAARARQANAAKKRRHRAMRRLTGYPTVRAAQRAAPSTPTVVPAPGVSTRCHGCGRLDVVSVAELELGCRHCGTWRDGYRPSLFAVACARLDAEAAP